MNIDTDEEFDRLVRKVRRCTKCERMCDSARVLSRAAGPLSAKLMFIGEAPGRMGADRTTIPFHGDKSGDNFTAFLKSSGISRSTVFVTNSVLCNPKSPTGNNATPSAHEITNCNPYLLRQIELVQPDVVVTLGATALKALSQIEPHTLSLTSDVRTANPWFGRKLIPLYHPGARSMVHRSKANQRSDYQFVAETVRRLNTSPRSSYGKLKTDVSELARTLIENAGRLSYFQLHKLTYLCEYLYAKKTGNRLTSAYYIRQKDGPYCTDLEVRRLKRSGFETLPNRRGGKLYIFVAPREADLFTNDEVRVNTNPEIVETVREALERYGQKSDRDLKTATYLTAPMRTILRSEQKTNKARYNEPIDFLAN